MKRRNDELDKQNLTSDEIETLKETCVGLNFNIQDEDCVNY